MHRLFVILTLILAYNALATTAVDNKSKYTFSLLDSPQRTTRPSGNISSVTVHELPILRGLSMRYLSIASSGVREPHWHANADEFGYCLNGSALVTIFGDHNEHESFIVRQGEMYYVPSGYLHHIENINDHNESSVAEFIVAFTNESPEDFGLSSSFYAMTNAVLGNTFGLKSEAFDGIKRRKVATVVGKTNSSLMNVHHHHYEYPNKFKFNAEGLSAKLSKAEGSVKTITSSVWSVLNNISMYSLRITTTGMREPHWHPKTAEMGYVVAGHARMTVLSPGDNEKFETYTLKPGDMYFVPRAYPHHIENIGNDLMHFLVFFDQPVPEDIGFTGSFSAYSRDVIAATLQCEPRDLPDFPFYPKDLLIVKRVNPVDP